MTDTITLPRSELQEILDAWDNNRGFYMQYAMTRIRERLASKNIEVNQQEEELNQTGNGFYLGDWQKEKQPDALLLADVLEDGTETNDKAAKELRRLHLENSKMLEALKNIAWSKPK